MDLPDIQETELPDPTPASSVIPRWTPDFDIDGFDVQAVFREASAQRKSVGKLLKSLGYPVAKFISLDVPVFKSADAVPLTASSTAVDLAGDDFDLGALKQMRDAALGTTVFLNHEYDVPEDVYGKVAAVEVVRRGVFNPLTKQTEQHYCLDLDVTPVGEDENPRAVRVTNMLRKSQLKLGVSVTVLVLKYKEREDGGRTITHVFYLESSMVGIPCNQTAWAEGEASKSAATQTPDSKSATIMSETNAKPAAGVGVSAAAPAARPESKFASTLATMKGMFADVLHENQNNFWLYVDSLRTVYRRLIGDARGKSGEAVAALVEEGNTSVDEFAAELKTLLAAEITEAATQDATAGGCYYDYWSAIGRLEGVVQKGGLPGVNVPAALKRAHARLVEAGAECGHVPVTASEGDEAKQASVAGVAELETKVASLTATNAELEQQLEAALQAAETATKELELEKATSAAAVTALEEFSLQPLPRAGMDSVS